MATTKSNFVRQTATVLEGTAVVSSPSILLLSPEAAAVLALAGEIVMDKQVFDLSTAGYAKNAAVSAVLAVSTPITLSLIALSAAQVSATSFCAAGDTSFATWNLIELVNTGANDILVGVGASNPANLPINGTTPTVTVPAGSRVILESVAGFSVDGTHKTVKIDPQAAVCSINIAIGGA